MTKAEATKGKKLLFQNGFGSIIHKVKSYNGARYGLSIEIEDGRKIFTSSDEVHAFVGELMK